MVFVRAFSTVVFVLSFAGVANAATMYKWVDENGEVHFSQTPPINNSDPDISYQQIDGGKLSGSVISPTKTGNQTHCGQIRLPDDRHLKNMSINSLNDRINSWNRSLKSAEQRLNQFLSRNSKSKNSSRYRESGSFSKELDRYQRPVHEYQCAVRWAKSKMDGVRDRTRQTNQGIDKLQKKVDVAAKKLVTTCGKKPAKYTQSGEYNSHYRNWKKCKSKHGRSLAELEQKLNRLKRQVN